MAALKTVPLGNQNQFKTVGSQKKREREREREKKDNKRCINGIFPAN